MSLLSFAIDLSRSTETKTLIKNTALKNSVYKERLLELYYKLFLKIETELYFQCLIRKITLSKLFLVKSIGDEIWYVYDFGDDESNEQIQLIHHFVDILISIVSKQDKLIFIDEDVVWEDESSYFDAYANEENLEISIPRKCYIDLLYDYRSFTEMRVDPILDVIVEGLKSSGVGNSVETLKRIIPEIASSLNLGVAEVSGEAVSSKNIRFDPIGRDVDLFFRCCHYAVPTLLLMGEKLFDFIISDYTETECVIRLDEEQQCYKFNYIKETISQYDIKGIDQDYSNYALLNFSSIPPLSINEQNPYYDGCEEARQFLFKHQFLMPPELNEGWLEYSVNDDLWSTFSCV